MKTEGETFQSITMNEAPAVLSGYHNYPGGLLEHIVSAANIALAICNSVEKAYKDKLTKTLL